MEMSPDAELRMNVYQEGQRAFNAKTYCPYTDWRAGTWLKGYTAAKVHNEKAFRFEETPVPIEQQNTMQLAAAAGIYRPWLEPTLGQLVRFSDLILEDAALQIEAMKPVHHFDVGDYAAKIRSLKSGT
jgi:hypothetical protein